MVALGVVPGLTANSAPSGKRAGPAGNKMSGSQPYYVLKLSTKTCQYAAFVNGGMVSRGPAGAPEDEQHPVNHWIRSGSNVLDLHVYKWPDEADRCEVTAVLLLKDADAPDGEGTKILSLVYSASAGPKGSPIRGSSPSGRFDSRRGYSPSDTGDTQVGDAKLARLGGLSTSVYSLSRSFELRTPFPEWAFFRGEKTKSLADASSKAEVDPLYEGAVGAYDKVRSLLEKKDVEGFLNACDERSREIDAAFFKPPGATRAALKKQIVDAMNDPELEFPPVRLKPGEFWKYSVGPTGQLIALTQGDRGSPIIRYQMKNDTPFSVVFPIVFRKNNGRYIVTR